MWAGGREVPAPTRPGSGASRGLRVGGLRGGSWEQQSTASAVACGVVAAPDASASGQLVPPASLQELENAEPQLTPAISSQPENVPVQRK